MTESNYLKEKTVRPVIGFIVFYILETIDIEWNLDYTFYSDIGVRKEETMEKFVSKLKLKDIRSYISKIDPIQILQEDNSYENFDDISKVSVKYDEYYVLGFGVVKEIKSEFSNLIQSTNSSSFVPCLEILLSKENKERKWNWIENNLLCERYSWLS